MNRGILLLLAIICALPSFARIKLISGSFVEMRTERRVPVVLDWSDAVYGVAGNLEDFLNKAERSANWEELSLKYFIKEFNEDNGEYGVSLVFPADAPDAQYSIVIKTTSIAKNGAIKGSIYLIKSNSAIPLGVASFYSEWHDDDDKITFKDQFEDIGESFGNLVKKELKKAYKNRK